MAALWKDRPKSRMAVRVLVLVMIYSFFGCKTVKERDLFFPRRVERPAPAEGRTDLTLTLPDGGRLGGWWVHEPAADRVLFYFYGNGETAMDSLHRMGWLARTLRTDVVCIDYRGYGFSDGTPGIDALLRDAVAAYDDCMARDEARHKTAWAYGRSIGTLPALQIASERNIEGLVLEAPFTTATDVIRAWRGNLPGILKYIIHLRPEPKLAKRRPQPVDLIRAYEGRLLVFHGAQDDIIPQPLGRIMFEAAPSTDKQWLSVTNAGHNDLSLNLPDVETALRTFFGTAP